MAVHIQPLLHDSVSALRAPTQIWSAPDGQMRGGIHGVFHGDSRVLTGLMCTVGGSVPDLLTSERWDADTVTFVSVSRVVDGRYLDLALRVDRTWVVNAGRLQERLTIFNGTSETIQTNVGYSARMHAADISIVKGGGDRELPGSVLVQPTAERVELRAGLLSAALTTPSALISVDGGLVTWTKEITVDPGESVETTWFLDISDASMVVAAARGPRPWGDPPAPGKDLRLARWLRQALSDLDALRMCDPEDDADEFFAAGAPWFFTLFGRDSLWSARMLLPLEQQTALGTLRALARRQGTHIDPQSEEQPGKILHELRARPVELLGGEGVLPPKYYGTIDATPLWLTLLHDTWQWGGDEESIRALLPAASQALSWMRDYGASAGNGFLAYMDSTGHGLSNHGWKDTGDSIQWRRGELAVPPIALCEVQGYAYEAAMNIAGLFDAFEFGDSAPWRQWAADLQGRFRERFWLEDEAGPYPAVALDGEGRPVDSLTSNIGHLLGTGILSSSEAKVVADRLLAPDMFSGFGIRTMSQTSRGYRPLSYHGGSVWAHDTAITLRGLALEGLSEHTELIIEGLLSAAEGCDYRVPELFSGEPRDSLSRPVPFATACVPQAWSAAAAVTVATTVLGWRSERRTSPETAREERR